MAKMKVSDIKQKFSVAIGDTTKDAPNEFIISALNWAFNELPLVPKLDRLFSQHKQYNLDAKGNYRWNLNGEFRRILDIPMLNFYTSTGGDPCKLCLCHKDVVEFYERNGLINIKQAGKPCEYTIEQEGDDIWLVMDRPLNIPVIIDYIAYGFPKPVESMEDEREISAIAENLILDVMRVYWLHEAEDYAFAADINTYLDNKKVQEATRALNRNWGVSEPTILGEK